MIIDLHTHPLNALHFGMIWDEARLLRVMDKAGVDKACLFYIGGEAAAGNRLTFDIVRRHPDRFIGFAFVNHNYPAAMQEELRQAIDDFGFKGIKIYPPFGQAAMGEAVWDIVFSFARDRSLPVLSHSDPGGPRCGPESFIETAQRFPAVSFILGHAGITHEGRRSAIHAAKKCPNLYLEICTSQRNPGSIEELVCGAGEDRILFGSDMPLLDPRIHIGRVLTADISDNAKRKVLGETAARLLRL